jgi:hypothetical protein
MYWRSSWPLRSVILREDCRKMDSLAALRSIYTIWQMEGVVQHATQKIGSILFLLCRATSKSVVQHKIHNTSVGLCKQTINDIYLRVKAQGCRPRSDCARAVFVSSSPASAIF